MFEELIFVWKVQADDKKEAEQKLRESYSIASTDRIVITAI